MIFELFNNEKKPNREERRAFPRVINPDAFVRFDVKMGSLNTSTFILRDLSVKGFSIFVGELDHALVSEDTYTGNLKLHDEFLEFKASIRWVRSGEVGFEFENAEDEQVIKLKSYLDPIQIGRSLKKVNFKDSGEDLPAGISTWYHGKLGTEVYFWNFEDSSEPRKWQFAMGSQFVEWERKLFTGNLVSVAEEPNPLYAQKEFILKFDAEPRDEILNRCRSILKFSEIEPSLKKVLNSSLDEN